jgi:hypothetical protein
MFPNEFPFLGGQGTRLQENRIGYSDLSNVVYDSGAAEGDDLLFR